MKWQEVIDRVLADLEERKSVQANVNALIRVIFATPTLSDRQKIAQLKTVLFLHGSYLQQEAARWQGPPADDETHARY